MKKRINTFRRIERLQSRLHEVKRARLAAIEQERVSLGDELDAVFEALATGALAYGAQARLGSRCTREIEKRIDSLKEERNLVLSSAREHRLCAKLAEQATESAIASHRDREERRSLVDLMDRELARRRASQTQG